MKTRFKILKKGPLLPLLALSILALTLMGCTEKVEGDPMPYLGDVRTETFLVEPGGTTITLFDETVELEFPGGTVFVPTMFTLKSIPLAKEHMKNINIMSRGFSIESSLPEHNLNKAINVKLIYNLNQFLDGTPVSKENLSIYNIMDDFCNYESIGECCVDASCNMILGCIDKCGFYVVGAK